MHEKGVERLEVERTPEFKTRFIFDAQGRLVKEEGLRTKRGRTTVTDHCTYRYNANGKLVARRCTNPIDCYLDSIAYDIDGRVTYYLASRTITKGPKKWRGTHVDRELRRIGSSNGLSILLDSTEFNMSRIFLNAQNEVARVEREGRIDSVSLDLDSAGLTYQRFWYRTDHPEFRLGQEVKSRNGRVLTESLWDMIGDGSGRVYRINYHYDEDGLLYSKENEIRYLQKDLYTYNESGLRMEHVTIHPDRVVTRRYRYWFK